MIKRERGAKQFTPSAPKKKEGKKPPTIRPGEKRHTIPKDDRKEEGEKLLEAREGEGVPLQKGKKKKGP